VADVTRDPEAWARLGAKIRERRETMGLSRRQLSESAGVSEKSIQTAEEGRTPRARWPQSLRLIEYALHWAPGSMVRILEGGEPEQIDDLRSWEARQIPDQALHFPDAPLIAEEEIPSSYSRSKALARLPKIMRAGLQYVLDFGRRAANHGADEDLVDDYEQAVEALLIDLASRPVRFVGYLPGIGRLDIWKKALHMDPMLRRKREDEQQEADRFRRGVEAVRKEATLAPIPPAPVVGDVGSGDVINELRRLREEVARLAKKVDGNGTLQTGQ
jgi:transcriptional regulator with XRE-family HTH domain